MRGVGYHGGHHDYVIQTGGVVVFPRVVAAQHRSGSPTEPFPSGVAAIDALLGGGQDRGTSALVMGPSGSGRSTLATLYLGQRGVLTLLVVAEHGVLGKALSGPADVSYLADAVVLVRYFEAAGVVRKSSAIRARHRQYAARDVLVALEHEVAARDQSLAMLGHELRNPLSAVTMALQILERRTASGPAAASA